MKSPALQALELELVSGLDRVGIPLRMTQERGTATAKLRMPRSKPTGLAALEHGFYCLNFDEMMSYYLISRSSLASHTGCNSKPESTWNACLDAASACDGRFPLRAIYESGILRGRAGPISPTLPVESRTQVRVPGLQVTNPSAPIPRAAFNLAKDRSIPVRRRIGKRNPVAHNASLLRGHCARIQFRQNSRNRFVRGLRAIGGEIH